MLLAIRHFPDRKRPVIVLEEGNKCLVIGYLTDKRREEWLRKATGVEDESFCVGIRINAACSLDVLLKGGGQNE
jgi:hypothetical protein